LLALNDEARAALVERWCGKTQELSQVYHIFVAFKSHMVKFISG